MQVLNSTDVRKDFSRFIDKVVHEKPVVFKRSRDHILCISAEQTDTLLEGYRFQAVFLPEDDGTITITLDGFDLVTNAPNRKQAIERLAEELINYSQDYFDQFSLYYKSANRRKHFPYVLRVVLTEDIQKVLSFIDA